MFTFKFRIQVLHSPSFTLQRSPTPTQYGRARRLSWKKKCSTWCSHGRWPVDYLLHWTQVSLVRRLVPVAGSPIAGSRENNSSRPTALNRYEQILATILAGWTWRGKIYIYTVTSVRVHPYSLFLSSLHFVNSFPVIFHFQLQWFIQWRRIRLSATFSSLDKFFALWVSFHLFQIIIVLLGHPGTFSVKSIVKGLQKGG